MAAAVAVAVAAETVSVMEAGMVASAAVAMTTVGGDTAMAMGGDIGGERRLRQRRRLATAATPAARLAATTVDAATVRAPPY